MKIESTGDSAYRLAGRVDLANLMDWRVAVESELPAATTQRVDLSALEFDGSAILALLVFLVRRARSAGGDIEFTQASERLHRMTQMAELSSLLSLK